MKYNRGRTLLVTGALVVALLLSRGPYRDGSLRGTHLASGQELHQSEYKIRRYLAC